MKTLPFIVGLRYNWVYKIAAYREIDSYEQDYLRSDGVFEYIFRCYKTDICNKSFLDGIKKMTWIDRCIIIGILILALLGLFLASAGSQWGIVLLFFIFVSPPALTAYTNRILIKNRQTKLEEYLQHRINPLTALLTGDKYNLFNKKSIDWLIERCDDMSGDKAEKSPLLAIFQTLLPVITLIFGALFAKMDMQEISLVAGAITMVVLCAFTYASIKDMFLGEDKRLVKELKRDLQYINTILLD